MPDLLAASNVPLAEFEYSACNLCGTSGGKVLFRGPDRLHHLPGVFQLVKCSVCGLIRQDPRPTRASIGEYYPNSYEPYMRAIDDEPQFIRRWGRRYGMYKRCRAVKHYASHGKLLDIGCATGTFINEMRRSRDWEVEGIEPNEEAARYAQKRLGLKVHIGRLADVNFAPSSFDVITMWNVLEHLHSPVDDLRVIHRLLKENGVFVFTIPNLESLEACWFGPTWIGWELPRHLYLFPQKTLIDHFPQLGFSLLGRQCLSGSLDTFALSLQLYLQDRYPADSAVPRLVDRAVRSLPARAVSSPFFWFLNRAKLTTVLTFFVQKLPVGQPGY